MNVPSLQINAYIDTPTDTESTSTPEPPVEPQNPFATPPLKTNAVLPAVDDQPPTAPPTGPQDPFATPLNTEAALPPVDDQPPSPASTKQPLLSSLGLLTLPQLPVEREPIFHHVYNLQTE